MTLIFQRIRIATAVKSGRMHEQNRGRRRNKLGQEEGKGAAETKPLEGHE